MQAHDEMPRQFRHRGGATSPPRKYSGGETFCRRELGPLLRSEWFLAGHDSAMQRVAGYCRCLERGRPGRVA
jgi:hypothetical protein